MPLHKLWSYLFGYVIIKIKGLGGEVFLQKAMNSGLMLWDVKRIREGYFIARMRASDFLYVRPVARGIDCYIEVWRKGGIPFTLPKLVKRPFLIGGVFLFATLIYVFSLYVWVVELEGIESLDHDYVKENVYKVGLVEGMRRGDVDTKELEHELLLAMPEVSWVGVRLRGGIATVQIVEKKIPPQKEGLYHIVASKPGLITTVIAFTGIPRVSEGDTVAEGDILIEGIHSNEDMVEARGIVKARVWYEARKEILFEEIIQALTGRQKTMYYIEMGEDKYRISPGSIGFKEYEVTERAVWSWKRENISVNLVSKTYKEFETIIYNHTQEDAERKATAMAISAILGELPEDVEVIEKFVSVSDIDEDRDAGVIARVAFETLEEIGKLEEMGGMSFIEESGW